MGNIICNAKFIFIGKLLCLFLLIPFIYSCKTTLRGSRPIVLKEKIVNRDSMSEDVRKQMLNAWMTYKKYAWGRDEVMPLSLTPKDYYGEPLLYTPLSAFSTFKLMKMEKEASECKELILNQLSFNKDIDVNHAEVVHIVLGGLLSAYEMDGDIRFLDLATDLGNRLRPVFKNPWSLSYRKINLKTGAVSGENSTPDEIGGLLLEYGTLSKLTNDPSYFDSALACTRALYTRKSKLNLLGSAIDIKTGLWTNPESNIMEGQEIWLDNLYKASVLFDNTELRQMFTTNTDAIIKYLREFTGMGIWYENGNMNYGTQVHPEFSAQSCNFPALLALAGNIKEGENIFESVLKYWAEYGIAPEQMNYKTKQVISASYLLRPQPIQAAAVLYKITGKDRFLKGGDYMYTSLVKFCQNGENGFAALRDVRTLEKMDQLDYYFFGATLKYAYMLYNTEGANALDSHIITPAGMMLKK